MNSLVEQFDPSVLKGADAIFYLNGKKTIFMSDINLSHNYNPHELRGIGSWFSLGAVSLFYQGNFTANTFVITKPREGLVKTPVMEEILTAPPMIASIHEKSTGRRVSEIICKLGSEDWNLAANAISGRRMSFMIIFAQHLEGYN